MLGWLKKIIKDRRDQRDYEYKYSHMSKDAKGLLEFIHEQGDSCIFKANCPDRFKIAYDELLKLKLIEQEPIIIYTQGADCHKE